MSPSTCSSSRHLAGIDPEKGPGYAYFDVRVRMLMCSIGINQPFFFFFFFTSFVCLLWSRLIGLKNCWLSAECGRGTVIRGEEYQT